MIKIGIIGAGNMGEAILRGILSADMLPPENVYVFDLNTEKIADLQQELGVLTAQSSFAMISACDMVLLAVKPNILKSVLMECGTALENKALLSIVLGWSRKDIAPLVPESCRVMRIMPNTPCLVGEGMMAFDADHTLTENELVFAKEMFSAIGKVELVPSYLMDAVTGVSGSGPAYCYLFLEAMADGGVRAGLPRNMAYTLAAQTMLGAAKMVLETGRHPGELKDAVCSPGGSTIEAVAALEKNGLRNAVLSAVNACVEKSIAMRQS